MPESLIPPIDANNDDPVTGGPDDTGLSLEYALQQDGSLMNVVAVAIQLCRRVQTLQTTVADHESRLALLEEN